MKFDIHDLTLLGCATIFGYYLGLFARKVRLPSLIGYMILGVFLGSSGLNIFSDHTLDRLSFISEITLAFVAFSIGSELKLSTLKRMGSGIITIILAESFLAFFLVAVVIFVATRDLPMALIFGAMAPASDPAGTVYVIQEYRAKGTLTRALYAVVGFDDGLAIIIFGFAAAMAKNLLVTEATGAGGNIFPSLLKPFIEIILSLIVGAIVGFIFSYLERMLLQKRDSIILVLGFILLATGLSITLHISLILTNMAMGFVFVNTRRVALVHSVLRQIQMITPFMYILFFCLAGAHMKLSALPALGMIGVLYIISRSAGLILGAGIGGIIGRVDNKIKKYIGMGILSQAGVAIGLSLIVRNEFAEIGTHHADTIGTSVLTMVTATCVFFGIIGPILTKFALEKAGEIQH